MMSGTLEAGGLSRTLDVPFLLLALIALSVFPIGFPDITSSITGLSPRDRRFQETHATFLEQLFGRK
jgi:hypothetical protein